ncbi:diguanylate cyclase domain-containing protein [uncultured Desulfobacter sp.]|uniref:diguanylate cyclase domain-containing protein n=1 Tax=uncultured Desulfobacter sp. TaxID=240139 RepID=UPI002AAAD302|nr:diguanylate cyclase [uncultured Desulfobacter sp.]
MTIEKEWNRACRDRNCLSLIPMDINFFKKYNDHYGHAMGDTCIKKVAKPLSNWRIRPCTGPRKRAGTG